LTRTQVRQLNQINDRILAAIESDERYGGRY
ncbi:TPA: MarR family transcriptional regulator, partial [Corynebacterium striatum]|nr:MarR family transcriptional regulator [Corynebacterium striatum]